MMLARRPKVIKSSSRLLVIWLSLLTGPSDAEPSNAGWAPGNVAAELDSSWNYWWSYSGVSGPNYWGLLNPDWSLCDRGRHQSPINIPTARLVFDPHLGPLRADNHLISGILYNDGHAIVFNASARQPAASQRRAPNVEAEVNNTISGGGATDNNNINNNSSGSSNNNNNNGSGSGNNQINEAPSSGLEARGQPNGIDSEPESAADQGPANGSGEEAAGGQQPVLLTGAGLAYPYQFELLYLRYGAERGAPGSEHQIDSRAYAAELQLLGYNSALYGRYADASGRPRGLLGVSVLLVEQQSGADGADGPQQEQARPLDALLGQLHALGHRGAWTALSQLNLSSLLPGPDQFVTYDGSLTTPGCHESVVWLVLNKPLYIASSQLERLRLISADEQSSLPSTGSLVAGNIRPVQNVNNRTIRTNIRPADSKSSDTCQRLSTRYQYKQT